ncbi:hypothetical protein C2I17_19195 [Niallia circulans]|nr:hypothetical protein C2I17_19195 [Niallia circulans]
MGLNGFFIFRLDNLSDKDSKDYRRYKIDEAAFVEKSLQSNGLIATNAKASLAADGLFHPTNGWIGLEYAD